MIKKQRKKIVIIGNGFDLAHDLKTSYKDFINWIYSQTFKDIYSLYLDGQFKETNSIRGLDIFIKYDVSLNKKILDIVNCIDGYDSLKSKNTEILNLLKLNSTYKSINNTFHHFKVIEKNIILKEIINQLNKTNNWCDIEYLYLYLLQRENTKTLNSDFNEIKELLIEYLKIESRKKIKIRDDYRRFFNTVKNGDLLLNFNYTNTFDTYLKSIKCNIINIHGTLNDKLEDVIFGYGNYNFKEYEMIEESNEDEKLEFFKLSQYLNNKRYSELMEYISEEDYEIVIIGHSCGLSDKSLLKTIFENIFCKKITFFYHQWQNNETKNIEDNFKELIKNISRYFSDKSVMLDIVENKVDSYKNDL